MRAKEFIIEKKRKKRKPRWAAYGPGPYGGYGYAVGYSGDSGASDGVGEDLSKIPTSKPIDNVQNWFEKHPWLKAFARSNLITKTFTKSSPTEVRLQAEILRRVGYPKLAAAYEKITPTGKELPVDQKLGLDKAVNKILDFVKNNPNDPLVKQLDTISSKNVGENFADGKVKGKSRPGRVKRAGASCNGSVTDLRKRAKNASGEKAKMYHWCANMKSGRNK